MKDAERKVAGAKKAADEGLAKNEPNPIPVSFLDDIEFNPGQWDAALLDKTIELKAGQFAYSEYKINRLKELPN